MKTEQEIKSIATKEAAFFYKDDKPIATVAFARGYRQCQKDIEVAEVKKLELMTDTELFDRLQEIVKTKCWKLQFNHDEQDGYFIEVNMMYSSFNADDFDVADLDDIKRETLRDAVKAAIIFLENPPIKRLFR